MNIKIQYFIFLTMILMSFESTAQITEGNLMAGGSGSFGHFRTTSQGHTSELTNVYLSPGIGYFIIDKLAVGFSGNVLYRFQREDENDLYLSYGISPFIRYYFLEKEKAINIFSEVSYEMLRNSFSDSKADKFQIKAGPVFFLTNSVALELALNYSTQKTNTD